MEVFRAQLEDIRPTQLYISKKKYRDCLSIFKKNGFEDYEPIPAKRIGKDFFFTDGHTRALVLWQNGKRDINVYYDTDDMDWIMYLVDLQWCRHEKIHSIEDLQNRVISEPEYQEKWLNRCAKSHKKLIANPAKSYMRTRKFYRKCGFRAFEDFPTLWGDVHPCLYMLKEVE